MSLEISSTYVCIICRDLMLEPVSLPCKHTTCSNCLEQTLANNKYQCFLCRKFIGSWYRNAKRKRVLINTNLQNEIRDKHPDLVEKRLQGKILDIEIATPVCPIKVANPGEIKEEFENTLRKLREEADAAQEKENMLSEQFIKQIREEELYKQKEEEERLQNDELFAKILELETQSEVENINDNLMLDEKLARELARQDGSSNSKIITSPSILNSAKKIKLVGPLDRFLGVTEDNTNLSLTDEQLARKLAKQEQLLDKDLENITNSPGFRNSMNKIKHAKPGPLDRFLDNCRKHDDHSLSYEILTKESKMEVPSPRIVNSTDKIEIRKPGPLDRFIVKRKLF